LASFLRGGGGVIFASQGYSVGRDLDDLGGALWLRVRSRTIA